MCAPIYRRDRRARFIYVIANVSLVAGLLLLNFGRSVTSAAHPWIDGFGGLFMGLSIGANLFVVLCARRCPHTAPLA